jgi:hypothetical protein
MPFDANNPLHSAFILACASLRARTFSLPLPASDNSTNTLAQVREIALKIPSSSFALKLHKLAAIQKEVEKHDAGDHTSALPQ